MQAGDGDESEDNDQTVTCDDLLPIECMHCGVKESETRTDDGSKARLVQHNDKACGCLLAVCDRCVRQCKGSRRLQCMCCGDKVRTVVAIEPGQASSVVRQFVEQSAIVGVPDKTCGQCRRQVPLLMLHARYGCGALLDACFDCAADVNVSIMCSGCAHKVCGQVVPVGAADVARKAMGTRKRKQPQRFGDYTVEKNLSQGKKNGIYAMQVCFAAIFCKEHNQLCVCSISGPR